MWKRALKKLTDSVVGTESPETVSFAASSTERALERITGRGLTLNTVIDVGASNGSWSEACMRYFPSASYFLVEAQTLHEPALKTFCDAHPNARYILAAAGNTDGDCFFDDSAPLGGLASNQETADCKTKLPMVRLDGAVAERKLPGPYLLKLDTHGFELQIIEGAEQILRHTALAVIEAYVFRLNERAMLFHELCMQMDRRGFQVVDFSEPMWRPKDMALWQWDLFFVRKDDPVFRSDSYD